MEDEYEYSVQYREAGTEGEWQSILSHDWMDREYAEGWLEAQSKRQPNYPGRLVRRRKAGPVEPLEEVFNV